jgi:hypothetical protein
MDGKAMKLNDGEVKTVADRGNGASFERSVRYDTTSPAW